MVSHLKKSICNLVYFKTWRLFSAVCAFNDGFKHKFQIMKELGLWPGKNFVKAMKRLESSRLQEAQKKAQTLKKNLKL